MSRGVSNRTRLLSPTDSSGFSSVAILSDRVDYFAVAEAEIRTVSAGRNLEALFFRRRRVNTRGKSERE
jgi:hypothetical protein